LLGFALSCLVPSGPSLGSCWASLSSLWASSGSLGFGGSKSGPQKGLRGIEGRFLRAAN
jgi:hypothetical protein